MWRQRLVLALRTGTVLMFAAVYLVGHVALEAGIGVVGTIVGASLVAAAIVCLALGRARFMYLALLFVCLGIGGYPLTLFGVSFDALAVMIVTIVGAITIAYGAAELRAEGGEPFRDPVGRLLGGDYDDDSDDAIHVPTASVIASDRYAAPKNRHDPVLDPR
jgi:hypothetical protein